MKKFLIISLMILGLEQSYAQLNTWSFESIDSLQKVEERDVMVFLHAPWCRYCKVMERSVLANKQVQEALNNNFWFVSFNGESEESIEFMGQSFHFRPTGKGTGIHQLAEAIGTVDGKVSFPTVVILSADGEIRFQHNAMLNKKQMLVLSSQLTER